MRGLRESLIELIRRTSVDIIEKNIELAKRKSQLLCQDTGSILFYVDGLPGWLESGRGRGPGGGLRSH